MAYVFSCTLTSTFYKLLEIERTRFARREGEPTPAALTQPATAVQGPMSAPLPGTAPGVSSRSSAPRAGLVPSSVTREDAHLQRICQDFYQVRGRTGAR